MNNYIIVICYNRKETIDAKRLHIFLNVPITVQIVYTSYLIPINKLNIITGYSQFYKILLSLYNIKINITFNKLKYERK